MAFDFETIAPKDLHDSLKWDKYSGRDVLPMWVADMDFLCPPAVLEGLKNRIEKGVFGYGGPSKSQIEAAIEMLQREFSWEVDPEWLVWLPGLVSGLSVTCRSVGKSGDGVLVNTPVYPPFLKIPDLMDRNLETVPLVGDNEQGWSLDRRRFELGMNDSPSLFLLCHPHNPVGRLWTEDELAMMAEVCIENRVIICSDEIHNQLVLDANRKHRPIATLGPEVASRTITLMAPSKTFNVPGLGCSLAIIPDASIRRRFTHAAMGIVPHVNVLGLAAAEACWRHGSSWHAELIEYLRANRDYLASRVAHWPGVSMSEVEATFLAWLDVRSLDIKDAAAHFESFGVGLSDGREFSGAGFLRLNFGCSRSLLVEACDRMEKGLSL
ncbi:MAG: putative C-S lyase [bacterium]|nr:putative C-S lyase [bacterium]